jgi:two-component system, response regulator
MTKTKGKSVMILLAEDDDDDFQLTCDAFRESHLMNTLRRARDGEELMDYLYHRNAYKELRDSPAPGLILLDLNMPRKDGREALRDIKSDPALKSIPIVVLTTSKAEEDVLRSYQLGVNSFIKKPVTFEALVEAIKAFGHYWLDIVEIPMRAQASGA